MTIHLSGQREQVVLSLLPSGKFASTEAVIDEALRLVTNDIRSQTTRGGRRATIPGMVLLIELPANLRILGDWARNWIPCPRPPLPMGCRIGTMTGCSTAHDLNLR